LKIGKMLLSVLLTLAIILTTGGCCTQTSTESSNEPESAHININEMSANSVGGDMHTGSPGEGSQQTPDRP